MPVFDFSGASDKKTDVQSECTYTTFKSDRNETSPENSRLWSWITADAGGSIIPAAFLQTLSNALLLNLKKRMVLSAQISLVLIPDL